MAEDPGFLGKLKAVYVDAPFERRMAEAAEARYDRLSLEAANTFLAEAARYVVPDNDGFTQLLFTKGGKKKLDEADQELLRDNARDFAQRQPHAIGYLRTLKRFVVGKGPVIKADTGDEELDAKLDEAWEEFVDLNDWDTKEDEFPHRLWRDGEVFVRKFERTAEGAMAVSLDDATRRRLRDLNVSEADFENPVLPAGALLIRFVDPEDVRDPKGQISHGIVTDADDVETVYGYILSDPGETGSTAEAEFVPADEIHHVKINVDSNVKRGRSQLEAILRRAKQYDKWLDYRIMLNLARTAIVLVKKIPNATPSQVNSIRNAQRTTRPQPDRNENRSQAFKPMTTVTSTGIEYEFKSPNINAPDAADDGRSILLNMSASTGIPEFMFTGDASNANFSSTLVAKGPAVREFESWQDFLDPHYAVFWRWAIETKAEYGDLDIPEGKEDVALKPSIEWEPPDVPDELKHTQANALRHEARILSKETWAGEDGLDYEEEKARLAKEREDAFGFTPPPPRRPGGEEDDDEGDDDEGDNG